MTSFYKVNKISRKRCKKWSDAESLDGDGLAYYTCNVSCSLPAFILDPKSTQSYKQIRITILLNLLIDEKVWIKILRLFWMKAYVIGIK